MTPLTSVLLFVNLSDSSFSFVPTPWWMFCLCEGMTVQKIPLPPSIISCCFWYHKITLRNLPFRLAASLSFKLVSIVWFLIRVMILHLHTKKSFLPPPSSKNILWKYFDREKFPDCSKQYPQSHNHYVSVIFRRVSFPTTSRQIQRRSFPFNVEGTLLILSFIRLFF